MGDSCCSEYSIGAVAERVRQALPGTLVHSIATGRGEGLDVLSSFFGSINEQVDAVCDELLGMQELQGGFVAVGFSQGGQFLRAVVQRCQHLGPRMHTLVTMGAQHQGVITVPGCLGPGLPNATLYCRVMQDVISRGAYSWFVQRHVVQAQYIKDPWHLDLYLQRSAFLADINNEVPGSRHAHYRDNLASLRRMVLVQFDRDDTVVPKESSHFGWYNGTQLVLLREQPLYQEDWVGLRALDEAGRLDMVHAPGEHMQFTLDWFEDSVIRPYLAVPAAGAAAAAGASAVGQQAAATGPATASAPRSS